MIPYSVLCQIKCPLLYLLRSVENEKQFFFTFLSSLLKPPTVMREINNINNKDIYIIRLTTQICFFWTITIF